MKYSENKISEMSIGNDTAHRIAGVRKHPKFDDTNKIEEKIRKKDPQEDEGYWPDANRTDQEPIRDELR